MPAKKKAAAKPARTSAPGSRAMTDERTAALATGRRASRAVRVYLEALDTNKPKRGRRRTPDTVNKRLTTIEELLPTAAPIKRLSLLQEQLDLRAELEAMDATVDVAAAEADFVISAKTYADTKGISYAAWRAAGVSPAVLKAAGITRTRIS